MNVPTPPEPPDPNVQRFRPDGRPTEATVTYERRIREWMKALAALLAGI